MKCVNHDTCLYRYRFIGAGKSTFINKQLQYRKSLVVRHVSAPKKVLYHSSKKDYNSILMFLVAITPNKPDTYSSIADEIASYIDKVKP